MPLYDFLAPAYDLAFEKIQRPFRVRALEKLPLSAGSSVLDLACGTGQNFPSLDTRLGANAQIIGLDISTGMLRRARKRAVDPRVSLIHENAANLNSAMLEAAAGIPLVDFVLCSYGFTSMRDHESAFRASWNVLKPGGGYGILDIYAAQPSLHSRAVEWATHSHFDDRSWWALREASPDFRMDYLDPSAHLFGGRVFVAWGTKPMSTSTPSSCPS